MEAIAIICHCTREDQMRTVHSIEDRDTTLQEEDLRSSNDRLPLLPIIVQVFLATLITLLLNLLHTTTIPGQVSPLPCANSKARPPDAWMASVVVIIVILDLISILIPIATITRNMDPILGPTDSILLPLLQLPIPAPPQEFIPLQTYLQIRILPARQQTLRQNRMRWIPKCLLASCPPMPLLLLNPP